jgi:transcriptional regulator with GAF, ATPase, and Fis domain
MERYSQHAVPAYRFTPVQRLEDSAQELHGLLKQTKKLKVEAEQKIFGSVEHITIGDNSSFTINQNQTLMILQVEHLAEEILQTVKKLKELFPHEHTSFRETEERYRICVVRDALQQCNNNYAAAARAIGMKRTTFKDFVYKTIEGKKK